MRNLDFLWLVLLGWLVAILTVQTNGWEFIFQNIIFQSIYLYLGSFLGPFFGSSISASLAAIGGVRSIRMTRRYPKRYRDPEFLCWGVCVLASLLIGLVLIMNIGIHFFVIGGPES
jgi:hypothetical protein